MKIRVGFQGHNGTFSEIAALQYFRDTDIEQVGFRNFHEIMKAVESKELDYAMIPVENTTTGIISRTYDLFKEYEVCAVGEIDIPIREDLIVIPGTKIEEIKEVYSHPEALSQCAGFFETHPDLRQVPFQDTARSVEYIKECGDRSKAALGSWRAREYYGMESLMSEIQDLKTNVTRFLVIAPKGTPYPENADKISMMMVLNHRPGALYNILGILAKNGVNVLKLESRPIQGKMFEYLFYIDFEGNIADRNTAAVIHEMDLRCVRTRILGCYKKAEF